MKTQFMLSLAILSFIFINYCPSQTGWQTQTVPTGNYSLTSVFPVSQSVCFATGEYSISTENYYSIYKTTNNGNNWLQVTTGAGWFLKNIKFVDSLTGYACGGLSRLYMTEYQSGKCVFKTTNGGQNWIIVFNLIYLPGFEMALVDMNFLNANTGWITSRDGSVLKTTNRGTNFTSYYSSPNFKKSSVSFVGPLYGWTAGDSGRIAYTINGGVNWTTMNSLSTNHLQAIQFLNLNTGYVCGNNGILLKSTNGGLNWVSFVSGVTSNLNSIHFLNTDTGWIAGINTVLKTTNGGINWVSQYSNSASLNSIRLLNAQVGWTCGGNKMLYTNSGGLVNIKELSSAVPLTHKLYNNYPNPFNPVTKIKIDISYESNALLKVFDVLGKEVITLLNKNMKPGTYEVEFNGANISSGIYYYKLTAGSYTETKSMIILK